MNQKTRKITYDICQFGRPISQFTIECDAQINFIEHDNRIINFENGNEKKDLINFLSNQELKVARLIIKHHEITNIKLAKELKVGPSTISTYKKRIREKLEIKNMRQLREYKDVID